MKRGYRRQRPTTWREREKRIKRSCSMPRITDSQQSGAEAEATFATFVARNGGIWSSTGQHSDFGLDGRVEITDADGQLTGAEFGVQIKGTNRVRQPSQRAHSFGQVRRDTLHYWLSRITPTLVVGCELQSGRIFAEWAHLIFAASNIPPSPPRQTVPLKFLSEPVNREKWHDLCQQALNWHNEFTKTLHASGMKASLSGLYEFLCQVEEELIELVCYMVMGRSETAMYAIHGALDQRIEQSLMRRLLHPPRLLESGLALNAMVACIEAAATNVDRFRASALPLLGPSSGLLHSAAELSRWLNLIEKQMGIRPLQETTREGQAEPDPPALRWVAADVVGVMTGAVAALLVIRDFTHGVRPLFNPTDLQVETVDQPSLLSLLVRTPASELLHRWEFLHEGPP